MGEFSITHLLLLAFVLLIFFGPSRLPGLGSSIGKAIRGFKEGLSTDTPPERGNESEHASLSGVTRRALPEPDVVNSKGAQHVHAADPSSKGDA